jgi:hypothetical protein
MHFKKLCRAFYKALVGTKMPSGSRLGTAGLVESKQVIYASSTRSNQLLEERQKLERE